MINLKCFQRERSVNYYREVIDMLMNEEGLIKNLKREG